VPVLPAPLVAKLRSLSCTPAEAVALGILAVAALAAVGFLWLLGRPAASPAPPFSGPSVSEAPSAGGVVLTDGEVLVHVAGAVVRPGVYTLPGGSRVGDAVAAAGGGRRRAVLDGLNLARPLTDGEQVLVPDSNDVTAQGSVSAPAAGALASPAPALVSLNAATIADLETLPGIGPVLGQRILDHRDSIGGFTEVAELREVSGIGEKTFQSLAPLVTP
jgi:competence protein ComEA